MKFIHKYSSSFQLTNKVKLSEYRKQQVYIFYFSSLSQPMDGFQNSCYMRMRDGDTQSVRECGLLRKPQ